MRVATLTFTHTHTHTHTHTYVYRGVLPHFPPPLQNMFELLGQHPALADKPGATALVPQGQTIGFHDVCFQVCCAGEGCGKGREVLPCGQWVRGARGVVRKRVTVSRRLAAGLHGLRSAAWIGRRPAGLPPPALCCPLGCPPSH